MDTMLDVLSWFAEDEEGAAAIEYGLIASLVSVAAVAALGLMGESLASLLDLAVEALRLPE
jgi:pilus assembly protein Flp/PilA